MSLSISNMLWIFNSSGEAAADAAWDDFDTCESSQSSSQSNVIPNQPAPVAWALTLTLSTQKKNSQPSTRTEFTAHT